MPHSFLSKNRTQKVARANAALETDNWRVSLHELDAFLAIVYALGAHKAAKIKVHKLWKRLLEFQLFLKLWLVTDLLK